MLFAEFLRTNAKFHVSPVTITRSISTSDVNDLEVSPLPKEWKPLVARRDSRMVDSLLTALDNYLGDTLLPSTQVTLAALFEPWIDRNGESIFWSRNRNEYDVC